MLLLLAAMFFIWRGVARGCVKRSPRIVESGAAVERALNWLARHQESDGRWDGERFQGQNADAAITGLATLAFLCAGHTQTVGRYKATVRKAVNWIVSQQDADGCIGSGFEGELGYHHAICGLALAEDYSMTRIERVREAAQKAVDWSIDMHQREDSGSGFSRKRASNTAVAAWFVMQLKSAQTGCLRIDRTAIQGVREWLERVPAKPAGRVSYCEGRESMGEKTAVTAFCRQLLGWEKNDLSVRGAVEWLMVSLPRWDKPNFRYWYFGTLAMFLMGRECWKAWDGAARQMLVRHQCKDGSWDPAGPWSELGGRVYTTALGAMCLQIHSRSVPSWGSALPAFR